MYTTEQRIERAKVSMIRDPRFAYLAGVFMLGKTEVTDSISTACTNGKDVSFNPAFVADLDDAELRGLIYHEYGGHIMMRHLTVYQNLYKQNPSKANRACDYVVNQAIVDYNDSKFIRLPVGGLQNDKYRGMDSKQVFNLLDDEDEESIDEHNWEGAAELSEQEQKELARDIESAVQQSVMASNLMGNDVDAAIKEWLHPRVDWREALRDFIITSCSGGDYSTYRKPRRRMLSSGLYMPTSISESLQSVVLAVDTSISIEQSDLDKFLAEVVGVCEAVKPDMVHIIYWGSKVVGYETYDASTFEDIRSTTRPVYGGGTIVSCVPEYMREHNIDPTCTVVLTDGDIYGGWGTWDCPVLWAMTSDRVADVGQTVCMKNL